ncbi:guanidinoacetate N-methyltransferase [Malassezia brasiliensis]|uniref:tRNA (adenine(58)-N(1))-methyltransferase catalytic subunit TRM61 n=1 Tax=Malassezia brasiliensis TaxID=1821822 RepID=A0AAF0INQ6_9BASI|nr:guanidinoacetate N-methyltransferase [Malassezia brasiliensis]
MAARRTIAAGDVVIVFVSRDRTPAAVCVEPGQQLVNLYGTFPHDDMIGKPYGCKLHARSRKGFVYLLRPTPELWTVSLPHRTQILYAPDMSFIVMKLNVTPGAAVIEAGTGSGSFTHTLARAVARGAPAGNGAGQLPPAWNAGEAPAPAAFGPLDGRVYSFEFHGERVERARAEFAAHNLDRTVQLAHRNVCKDGFGLDHVADAVFLDLPAPWEAVPHVAQAVRRDVATRICCFSPCIEQVLRTVTALSEHGFHDISTYESLIRTHESLTNVAPLETVSDVVDRIRTSERRREARREIQIANSRQERERKQAEKARKEAEAADQTMGEVTAALEAQQSSGSIKADVPDASDAPGAPPAKRKLEDDEDDLEHKRLSAPADDAPSEPPAEMLYSAGFRQKTEIRPMVATNVYSRPFPQMRGHTSYLTFATLQPQV